MKKKTNKGITLIALVITIIVLLILAAVSIATLTGENGILSKANRATEENKKAEYEEIIKLIGNGIKDEKVLENLSAEEFIERYKEEIEKEIGKGKLLEGASVKNRDTTTLRVTTKEGWIYEITENKVELLGKKGENPPPDLQETDIDFILTPSGYTTGNVTVEIKLKIEIQGFVLQYSRDGENWNNYTEEITYTENGPIYARLINRLEETGQVASKEITNIDREKPNEAIVSFSSTTTDVETSITATVTQTDKGNSEVDFTKSKWKYVADSGTIGTNPSSYPGTFTKSPEDITLNATTPGTYYLHVLTVDKAGNSRETIKGPITVTKVVAKVGVIVTGKNKEYEKNGTAIIPVGFAIVPGCDDISQGLVISDVANDTGNIGNQFVWIPVTDGSKYVRNTSYTETKDSSRAFDISGYLPTGITNEKQAVVNKSGFYVARYETGVNLVSKRGATVWNGITPDVANSESKKFVNNAYVKSALISGVQWDVIMTFVNGKRDGTGNTFNVTVGSSTRQLLRDTMSASGQNEADRVCNIYDLEGNYHEHVAEGGQIFNYSQNAWVNTTTYRGGCNKSVKVWFSASYRRASGSEHLSEDAFRMVLYVVGN